MRKSCPNYDHEDGLDTVYEVPIPEEIIISCAKNGGNNSWKSMKSWIRNSVIRSVPSLPTNLLGGSRSEIQILLGVVGAPLVPIPVPSNGSINRDIKNYPSERSMAKYIVQQYIAATGGDSALDAIDSMLAVGKVKMIASDFYNSGDGYNTKKEVIKAKSMRHQGGGGGEVGSFVLWQKRPDLWSLELILSGCKMNAGSNGQVAWRQTPWQNSHASRGPPRPLRRCLQGLDPRSTANLFSNSNCIGEKAINDEDCFVLELETEASTLRARSSSNLEIIRHTILGYFSQKTGLLVKFEDSHLLRIKTAGEDNIFWETTMESLIQDYRIIDGINIAHGGRTFVSLFRFGDSSESHSRTRMEEVWAIEDVDFNIEGLGMECFLPPSDLKKEQEGCNTEANYPHLPFRTRVVSAKIGASKVAAIDLQESDSTDDEEDSS